MASAQLIINKASNAITIQDLGRWGSQHVGVSPGGAADKYAQGWANHLINNSPELATLELCFGNCEFSFTGPARAAITGADCHTKLNDRTLSNWTAFDIRAGDRLSFSFPSSGIYSYLAIKHGFQIEHVLGSATITPREKIGPNHGSVLRENDRLSYELFSKSQLRQSLHWSQIPNYENLFTARVIASKLSKDSQINWDLIENMEFSIHPNSNKMGLRLSNAKINGLKKPAFSEGVVEGSIQVPPNGEPIILMADHQTIGGYPILGCVYAADIPGLAQLRPGQKLYLKQGSVSDALSALHAQKDILQKFKYSI